MTESRDGRSQSGINFECIQTLRGWKTRPLSECQDLFADVLPLSFLHPIGLDKIRNYPAEQHISNGTSNITRLGFGTKPNGFARVVWLLTFGWTPNPLGSMYLGGLGLKIGFQPNPTVTVPRDINADAGKWNL